MIKNFEEYDKGIFLGIGKDMAHHEYATYKVDKDIHIVYESDHIAKENIQRVKENMEEYLWTPYIQWIKI